MKNLCIKIQILLLFAAQCQTRNAQVGVNNKVEGDQTVGGVHLFEVHTPEGGMGFGIKVMVFAFIIGVILYWFIRQRVKKCRRALDPYSAAAGNVSHFTQLAMAELAPVHPQPPVQAAPPQMFRYTQNLSPGRRARRLSDVGTAS